MKNKLVLTIMKKLISLLIPLTLIFNTVSSFASTINNTSSIMTQMLSLTQKYGGRLGIYAINTTNGDTLSYNARQRFPVCSTSKSMVVGAVLKKSMEDPSLLSKVVHYSKIDLVKSGYTPVTKQYVKTGMTVKALSAAAISYSDNAAANLLMKQLGGPKGVTTFARSIGDVRFNLVRYEPHLNTAIPGDKRDTSTPRAMTQSLQKLVLGKELSVSQQQMLKKWLIANTTGNAKIRAGVPKNWIVGDKTGEGRYGTTNDIAVIWPPHCRPIILSIYYTQDTENASHNQTIIAKAAHYVVENFAQKDSCILNT